MNKILKEIDEYLIKNEVNQNTLIEVINLYDLYNIINKELEDLRYLLNDSLLKKKYKKAFFNLSKYYNETVNSMKIRFSGYRDILRINFYIKYWDIFSVSKKPNETKIEINNGDSIYLKNMNTKINKFIYDNYNLILQEFSILEKYVNILGPINFIKTSNFNFYLENELFVVPVIYNDCGINRMDININEKCDLHKYINGKVFRKNIINLYINKNKEKILKSIAVPYLDLPEDIKKVYDN